LYRTAVCLPVRSGITKEAAGKNKTAVICELGFVTDHEASAVKQSRYSLSFDEFSRLIEVIVNDRFRINS
jgi:hypothetical protein